MDAYRFLKLDLADGLATLTIDRADKLNALNAEVIGELDAALRRLAGDDGVRGVIVTGAGAKAFVAGADIGELAQMGPLSGVRVSRAGQETFRFLERMRKPVVAAVRLTAAA